MQQRTPRAHGTPPDQVLRPRPPRLSVFKSLPTLLRGDLLTLFGNGVGKGKIVRLDTVYFRLFQINDVSLIRTVLLDKHRVYRKGRLMRRLSVVTGEGLLINDGDLWRRHRRYANPAMSGKRLHAYVAAMRSSADRLVQRWRGFAGKQSVDLVHELSEATLMSLLRTLFGIEYDARYADVSAAIHALLDDLVRRGSALLPRPLSWPTQANRRFRQNVAAVEGMLDSMVATRRATLGAEEVPTDMLGSWLRQADLGQGHMSATEMRNELMTMLIAGHHSLAITLSWALYELARHEDVQARTQAECDALAAAPSSAEELLALSYTRGVFLEALRLYPQPPVLLREALRDHVLGEYQIRAGDQLIVNLLAVHLDAAFWPAPRHFEPSRFADFNVDAMMQGDHLGFGGGPRSCIGRRFALQEGVLLLAQIARAFRLRPTEPGAVKPQFAGMMVPSRPLLVDLTMRHR